MHLARTLIIAAAALSGACASSPAELATGQAFDDGLVTVRVKRALFHQKGVRLPDVEVDTRAGQVHLSGFVPDDEARRLAEEAARRVEGVKAVKNDIRIAPGG